MQIALLGCGHMGGALIKAMSRDLRLTCAHLFNPTTSKAELLAQSLPRAQVHLDAASAIKLADVVILAMKPYGLIPCLREHQALLSEGNPLLLSLAAGLNLATMEAALPHARIIRLMPNTPVEVGQGASGLVRGQHASDADVELCMQLMAQTGRCIEVEAEEHMHLVTALAGSAPAYFYELLDVMGQFGLAHGLSQEDSLRLASQAMLGAARLQQVSGSSPTALRNAVTSPNGVTLAALRRLNSLQVKEAWMQTLEAALNRSIEMEQENA